MKKRSRLIIFEAVERRDLFAVVPNANPIVRPDHIVVVIDQDRFCDAIGDIAHMPYTNQLISSGLFYSNSHGVGHPSEVNTLGIYSGNTFSVTDNGGNYTFATQANLASVINSTQVAPGQFLSFSGFVESLPADGDMTTVIAKDPGVPTSPPDQYNRRYNPMAQFLNVGTRNGVAVSTAAVNRTFASFPTTATGFANLPTISYVIGNSVDNGHGSNEQDPYATDPAAYNIHRVNADNWLKNKIDPYFQWAKNNNSLLIVTTDEEETDTHPTSTITTLVNGDSRLFVGGVNPTSVSHFNLLRTLTDMYGVSPLGSTSNVGALTTNALGQLAPQAALASATMLASSNASTLWGQDVTFTATVTGAGATPGGAVTFKDGANVLGTGTLNASGVATFTPASPLAVGSHSITAVYGGNGSYLGSTSAPFTQNVAKAASSASLNASPNPSTFGQSVTLTATISRASTGTGNPSLLGGAVSFYEGATLLGSAASIDASGVATLSLSSLSPGGHVITAVYDGNTNFTGSTSNSVTQTVNQISTSTQLASSVNPSVLNQSVTLTATVTTGSGAPTGTIAFLDGTTTLANVALGANGQATFSTSSLSLGGHNLTAVYSGNTAYVGSTSTTLVQSVGQSGTTTALAASINPSTYGQSVTFTATVSPQASGAGMPTGTVTFFDGANSLGTGTLDASGVATLLIANLAAGSHSITAVYNGDSAFSGSTSSALSQTVSQAATSTALGSSANPSTQGDSVTFTATVSNNSPGSVKPTGTVNFVENGNAIGSGTLDTTGVATFTTSALVTGSHTISAVYVGDTNFTGSTSSAITQTVNSSAPVLVATTTTVGSSVTPSAVGQPVSFTATVAPSSGSGTPTGTVQFLLEGVNLGSPVSLVNGSATTPTTSFLTPGTYHITVVYNGDTSFATSTASSFTQTVNMAATSSSVSSSVNPSVWGQGVAFTATVTASAPGAGTPTGSVQFMIDGNNFGSPVALVNGSATSSSTNTLSPTGHTITAIYSGDSNFAASTAPTLTQTVNKGATSSALSSSVNPSVWGQSVTFTATVTATAPGAGTPSGTVQFMIDGSNFGSPVALVNGSASSLSTNTLQPAGHTITAVYSGDSNFTTSAAPTLTHTVNKAATTTSVASNLNPSLIGQSVTFTATVLATSPGAGIATGTITFKDGSTTLGTATLNSAGQATFATSSLSVASHSITAVYGGSTTFNGSTSPTLTQTVNSAAIPAAPASIAATDGTFLDRVTITWAASVNATSYEVWRNTTNASSSATRIGNNITTLSYDDVPATIGKTYYYWVKAKNATGTSGFSAVDTGFRAPVNNNFANATVITGKTVTLTTSNVGATKESGEPAKHAANKGGASLWWFWTPTSSGTVTIDTLGSNFDTLLAVYTGSSVSTLTSKAANDDSPAGGTLTSKVSFAATAGTTYRICVDGYDGVTGNVTMHLNQT